MLKCKETMNLLHNKIFIIVFLFNLNACQSGEIKKPGDEILPKIISLSSSDGIAGDKIVISGSGFNANSVVMFGSEKAVIVRISTTEIEVTVPPGQNNVVVQVYNGKLFSNSLNFSYKSPTPVITEISKEEGIENDTISISGTNFNDESTVFFETNIARTKAPIIDISPIKIRVKVPSISQTGSMSVKVYNGKQESNSITFVLLASYVNPVFEPILADPTFIKDPVSGKFFAYGTADYWHTDNRSHLVAVVRSNDFTSWNYIRDAFNSRPVWKSESNAGIWAPDINYINGKYYLFYSYSTWGDPDPGIGLAIADKPEGPFNDQGKLFLSSEINVRNSIDPLYFEENGKKFLFWGSYRNNSAETNWGTFVVDLSEDGKSVIDKSKIVKIAASDFEGVVIHKRAQYYYFFGSRGGCCAGINSTYHVLVGRSTSLKGPYYDKKGNDLAKVNGAGTLVLNGNSSFVGPGHASRIITDKGGNDWILYHAMPNNSALAQIGGVNQRALMLDEVIWSDDGWPLINDGTPSYKRKPSPKF